MACGTTMKISGGLEILPLYFVPGLRRKAFIFSPNYSYMAFTVLNSFYTNFVERVLIMSGYFFFLHLFEIIWFFPSILLMCCRKLIDLCIINHRCKPGINPTW